MNEQVPQQEVPVLTPSLPEIEVASFNIKAAVIIRNSDGKIAAIRESTVDIVQSHFGVTLESLASQMIEQLKTKLPEEDLAPLPRSTRRALERKLEKAKNG